MTELQIRSAGSTHQGLVRKHNEDAFLDRGELGLWVVADGMGGHQSGDVASRTIVDSLRAMSAPSGGAEFLAEVRTRLSAVNEELQEEAAKRGGGLIGSTVVALITFGSHFACLWAGDSRLYLLRGGDLSRVSRDHSQVQDMVDAGVVSAEDAEKLPIANVITRAVGSDDTLVLDKVSGQLEPGDLFLLCSDGVTKMISDDAIASIMRSTALDQIPDALIQAALDQGGKDNVTAVVVSVE